MASLLSKFFPTPRYLSRPAAGLDISDQSVKFIELSHRKEVFKIVKFGEKAIPVGTIESGVIKNEEQFVATLKLLVAEHNLSDVVVSLPEEEAYIIRLDLPYVDLKELRSSLELQLEEHIPVPVADIVFDYEVLSMDEHRGYDLSLSAFPRNIIEGYSRALAAAGLIPVASEIEAQAISRSIVPAGNAHLTMIVDFGKTRTSFFIVTGEVVLFTATAKHIGGEDITKSVQKSLNLSYAEAEKLKIERGLLSAKKQQELFFAILPIVSVLKDEIVKHFSWWESRRGDDRELNQAIERVIVCGGQATLPGLIDYLNLNLDLPVELGNPWTNIFVFDRYIPPINLNQSLRYTTSLGLALRGISTEHD
ncbi:MAG: type IV pilus assembly protein PilM [Patescibacteria group bacterium]